MNFGETEYENVPDYILGITWQIWEDRDIAALRRHYAPNIIVRSPASVVIGNEHVISATMATLAEFPDRTLLGEDVIWCDAPNNGILSSHRLISTATKSHPGLYGPASNQTLKYRIIADCHVANGVIDDEWIIRDQGAIVRQLEQTPQEYARKLLTHEADIDHWVEPYSYANDVVGPYTGFGNESEWAQAYADIVQRIMNAEFNVVPKTYDRAVQLEYPGGVTAHSHSGVDQFWMGLRSSFPSAVFKVCHQMGRNDKNMSPRAALRWTLSGKHDGWGAFGTPTAAEVFVMGASHVEFGPRGVRREWVLIDEVSIWKQILNFSEII
ncbi:MAG: ester cyclase [Aestuariivita sp.]|nr:ester cyclase [Aestuariivita sp.]